MPFPRPAVGQVIRYSYLWSSEHARGREEGVKDRPCAVVLLVANDAGDEVVTVLPITHTPPSMSDANLAVELPSATERRLGLDDGPSWVVLAEANRFTWPGPDLRAGRPGDPSSAVYGLLPRKLYIHVRDSSVRAVNARQTHLVSRTQ